ncbi:hypothetical protein AABB24_033062 [Solanum stoloniferum]|uniref:Peptidase M50 domain-containing protein n=1 Tax=Solanum stoloniferum TaxID=62892 RepID=A0ABD2RLR3_9SOLN
MIINLSPSSCSLSLSRFINSKRLTKTHLSKSLSSSSSSTFHSKNQFLHEKNRYPLGRRRDFRSWVIPGFDFGNNFESTQSVLEAVGVLTAIIVVHESGHFLAAYLQGIHGFLIMILIVIFLLMIRTCLKIGLYLIGLLLFQLES